MASAATGSDVMKLRHVVYGGVVLSTQAGCTCGSAVTAVPTFDGGSDAEHVVTTVCDNAELLKGCVAESCTVTATGNPLPKGAILNVTQKPAPSDLSGDTIDPVLCSITVSDGVKSVPNLRLSMALKSTPASDGVLFQYVSPNLSQLVVASEPSGKAIEGLVTAPGEFGTTENPRTWSPDGMGGISVTASADEASLILNLSSLTTNGAYYDGTHLFVCNGPRLLVYNGLPANPGVKPAVVLGQPDLDTFEPETSSSFFGGQVCWGIWSNGKKLAVAQGSRILIWNAIPTADQTPADLELGQPDFSSNTANNGGISASSLWVPYSVDSDGTTFVVADTYNCRVLLWNAFPTVVDQPADLVIGQPGFTTNTGGLGTVPVSWVEAAVLAQSGLFVTSYSAPGLVHVPTVTANNPPSDFTVLPVVLSFASSPNLLEAGGETALTPNGGLAVRDVVLGRVDVMNSVPTGPAAIDFALGQPALDYIVWSPTSASVVQTLLGGDDSLGGGSTVLVPDAQRLLIFDTPPSYSFEPASRVLGQAGFTTNGQVDYRGISASTLAGPSDVAIGGGMLALADRGNNRVLLYNESGLAIGATATVVLGQPNATSYVPNLDQQTPSAARLSGPAGVALDGTHLIVSDTENHRVLIWNTVPTANGAAADLVLGQTDFTGRRPNHGNGDTNGDGFCDADATSLFYPTGVASDGTHLFVADRVNNRVLIWNTFPTSNGQAADAVIGQTSFTNVQANANGGGYAIVPTGLNLPTGVSLVGTSLWIADTENNRAVRWDNVTTTPAPGAFVGQPDGTTVTNANYVGTGQPYVGFPLTPGTGTATGSVLRPRSVVVSGDQLYISESDSNRVHMFSASTFAPVGELGQRADSSNTPNSNGASAASLETPRGLASDGTHLWVADSANNRVLGFGLATDPVTGASASIVLGQLNFLTNGFNQSSTAANGATSAPRGLSAVDGKLYVADTNNHRVLEFGTPLVAGEAPSLVYGQPNGTLALPNSGGVASASTLDAPRGVFSDGIHVFIADTGNNRVLVSSAASKSTSATLVLGQSGFTETAANAGGASAKTMQAPTGVYYDGTRLWVADTGNHRVLVWNSIPTSNGKAADLVLGQASFADVLPNRGGAAPSASTLSFPAAIESVGGVVYIADTGNNRVVSFTAIPKSNGASANGVLGQPNLTSRLAATLPVDLTELAGPVGLTADDENLYVVDRDLSRALVYRVGTIKSAAPAAISISSAGGLSLSGPGGIAAERTPYFTSRVYLADTGHNDVAIVSSVSRLATP
jgi:hypothetical protein